MEDERTPEGIVSDSTVDKDSRQLGMFCHLLGLCFWIAIPFANILAPLIIWLAKREDSPFVDACGKDALNFQISMTIYFYVSILLILLAIGLILVPVVLILHVVFTIIASIEANKGIRYQYPMTITFIR